MRAVLLVALVDELWSGVAVAGAPSVEQQLSLSHGGYVAFAFALPLIGAAVLEAGAAILSDVWGRARLVIAGQAALAVSLAFTGWTASPWGLTLGLALAGAASGVACSASQAILIAGNAGHADRALVRWSIFGSIGDVLTPLVTASAIALGHSYRAAMVAVALLVTVQCAASSAALHSPRANDTLGAEATAGTGRADTDEDEPLFAAVRRAARLPRLWVWLCAAASCTLLDELVVALAALRLEHDGRASSALAAAVPVAFSLGTVGGEIVVDRLLPRFSARALLVASGTLSVLSVAGLVVATGPARMCLTLFVAGVACAPHHPLAMARACGELPERPGTVQALGQIFVVTDVGIPLVVGVVADQLGLRAAFACLLFQPIMILVCASVFLRSSRTADQRPPP